MATVGQQLLEPENGWRRYDDTDSKIMYFKGESEKEWVRDANNNEYYNSSFTESNSIGNFIKFRIYSDKLRIIALFYTGGSSEIDVLINGKFHSSFSVRSNPNATKIICKEIIFDKFDNYEITLINKENLYFTFDALDIADNGYLANPILNQVNSLDSMQIGDCISCRYTATSGAAGTFSELGTCDSSVIPVTGTATPDGLFYFIKVDKGTLIADRVVQTNISWTALNNAKYIEGCSIDKNYFKTTLTSYENENISVLASKERLEYSNLAWKPFSIDGAWFSYYPTGQWIKIKLKRPLLIKSIGFIQVIGSGSNTCAKDITIETSHDDEIYTNVYSGTLINTTNEQTIPVSIDKSETFIKINILNSYYSSGSGIAKINLNCGEKVFIRSLSGGCAFSDSNGNSSLADMPFGAWPVDNEYDKYIVNSDLDGKIIKDTNEIWHSKNLCCWTQDTPITNLISHGVQSYNNYRVSRGYSISNNLYVSPSSNAIVVKGFRPVLNYIESDIASEVIY